MDIRRAANAVLRSQAPREPLAAFLMPSMPIRWQPIARRNLLQLPQQPVHRGFATSCRRYADSPTDKTRASKGKAKEKSEQPAAASQSNTSWSGAPRSYSGMFESPDYKPTTQDNSTPSNSASNLLNAFKQHTTPGSSPGFDASRMAQPPRKTNANPMWGGDFSPRYAPEEEKFPLRLTPAVGRIVEVHPQVDLGRAFRILNSNCHKNKINATLRLQKYHERPGLKRKRLKRERWRKKFLSGFKAAVNKVKELKKQGW